MRPGFRPPPGAARRRPSLLPGDVCGCPLPPPRCCPWTPLPPAHSRAGLMPQGLPSQSLVQVLAPELPAKLPPSASGMEFSREAEGFGGKHVCTASPGVPSSHHHQQAHPAALPRVFTGRWSSHGGPAQTTSDSRTQPSSAPPWGAFRRTAARTQKLPKDRQEGFLGFHASKHQVGLLTLSCPCWSHSIAHPSPPLGQLGSRLW